MDVPFQPVRPEQAQAGSDAEVYTDGTYNSSGTMEEWAQGRQQESAAAGVVILSEQQALGFRITDVAMSSAYDAETVAIAVAGRLAPGATIHTDCKAAQDSTRKEDHRTGITHLMRIGLQRGEVEKVRAHAERRKHKRDWTRDEEGNIMADAVAGGRICETGLQEGQIDIERAISVVFPLVWRDDQGRTSFDTKSRRSLRYTSARDKWRQAATPPRPPRWEGTTARLGAAMWGKQECSWAQAVRIMWDKNVTGENEHKWRCKEIARCSVCGAITSQRHTIIECQRPGASAIRKQALDKVRREGDKNGNNLVGKTIRAVLSLSEHEDAHTLWTGLWSPAIRTAIAAQCPWTLTRREYSKVAAALRHLAEGALTLHRQRIGRGMKRTRETRSDGIQTRMEDYLVGDTTARTGHTTELECSDLEGRTEYRELDERVHDSRKYDR